MPCFIPIVFIMISQCIFSRIVYGISSEEFNNTSEEHSQKKKQDDDSSISMLDVGAVPFDLLQIMSGNRKSNHMKLDCYNCARIDAVKRKQKKNSSRSKLKTDNDKNISNDDDDSKKLRIRKDKKQKQKRKDEDEYEKSKENKEESEKEDTYKEDNAKEESDKPEEKKDMPDILEPEKKEEDRQESEKEEEDKKDRVQDDKSNDKSENNVNHGPGDAKVMDLKKGLEVLEHLGMLKSKSHKQDYFDVFNMVKQATDDHKGLNERVTKRHPHKKKQSDEKHESKEEVNMSKPSDERFLVFSQKKVKSDENYMDYGIKDNTKSLEDFEGKSKSKEVLSDEKPIDSDMEDRAKSEIVSLRRTMHRPYEDLLDDINHFNQDIITENLTRAVKNMTLLGKKSNTLVKSYLRVENAPEGVKMAIVPASKGIDVVNHLKIPIFDRRFPSKSLANEIIEKINREMIERNKSLPNSMLMNIIRASKNQTRPRDGEKQTRKQGRDTEGIRRARDETTHLGFIEKENYGVSDIIFAPNTQASDALEK